MSIDAMKQALDALEHEAQKGNDDAYRVERDALRAAIEQAQEPVALETVYDTIIQWYENDGKCSRRELARRIVALYTAPRQWQGLTDEEIAEVRHLYDGTAGWTIKRFARAIEAKLKEKNYG